MKKEIKELRLRFLKVYNKLPSKEKGNVCCVICEEPMSWNVVNIETKWNVTSFGEKALKQLERLELI